MAEIDLEVLIAQYATEIPVEAWYALPPENTVPEVATFSGIGDGRRNTEKQVSVYDAMMAELHGDKARRAEKWRKTHDRCKKSKDDTPADRKRNKANRLRKVYGLNAFEDTKFGRTIFIWDGKSGRKKFPEHEAEIFRNLKERSAEKAAYAELLPDSEHYVGTTTIAKMIDRLWNRLTELRKPYEDAGYDCYVEYYYERDGVYRYLRYYNDEYRRTYDDYEILCRLSDVRRAKKMRTLEYDAEDIEYFTEVGMRRFYDLLAEMHPEPRYIDEGWRNWRDYQDELDAQYWKDLAHLDDYVAEERGDYFLTEEEEDDWYD